MAYKGKYKPLNPQKYIGDINSIIYRSLWERKVMVFCDTTPSILKWSSEEIVIPYYYHIDKKIHKYFVDFIIQMKDQSGAIKTYLIEIKPEKQTKQPEKNKKSKKHIKDLLLTLIYFQILMPYKKIFPQKIIPIQKQIYNITAYEDISKFYDEVQHILCNDWKYFGRNLDALYDIVTNGYIDYKIDTEINIINSKLLAPKVKKVFIDAMENNNLLQINFL